MAGARIERRLAAILAGDVVGYSRLMRADEAGTLARIKALRSEMLEPYIAEHGGRLVKTTGDGFLVEFASAVDAVQCAAELQRALAGPGADGPRLDLRIGINLGDVIVEEDDLFGDGVNVAARLEGLAEPGGICVSGSVHEQVRGKLGLEFEDMGRQMVKNIDEPVQVYRVGGPAARLAEPRNGPLRPSVAVLPFDNMSADPEQEFFADGLVEDLITTLSKLAGLTVIARNSSFAYKGRAVDVRQAARELGVRYVLEGSVRRGGSRLRITAQLIDAADGSHLWAARYDRTMEDVFAIQDEITLSIATELQVKLSEGEQSRLRYTTTSNVAAWEQWIQGLAHFRGQVTQDGIGQARRFWEKALELDPDSAALNAMLGLINWAGARFEWWDGRSAGRARAEAYAKAALALDDHNPDARMTEGLVMMMRGKHDEAVAAMRRAIALAPGSADIAAFATMVFNFAGLSNEALLQIEKAMRLSPLYPAWYLGDLGFCYRLLGRHEEAIRAFREYGARSPGFGHADLVVVFLELGRMEKARVEAAKLMAARPDFTIGAWRRTQFYKDPARLEADLAALRAAGLPE